MCYLETWGEGFHYFPVIMFLFMILIMTVFILIIYRRRRYIFNSRWFRQNWGRDWFANCSGERTKESASDILKKRYARGEINKEEFEEMKKDISDSN